MKTILKIIRKLKTWRNCQQLWKLKNAKGVPLLDIQGEARPEEGLLGEPGAPGPGQIHLSPCLCEHTNSGRLGSQNAKRIKLVKTLAKNVGICITLE